MFDYKLLNQKIKQLREKNNLTQEEFSELINCNSKFLSRVETGKMNFFVSNIIKVLNIFNISCEDLITSNLDEVTNYNYEIMKKINLINREDSNKEFLIDLLKAINGGKVNERL